MGSSTICVSADLPCVADEAAALSELAYIHDRPGYNGRMSPFEKPQTKNAEKESKLQESRDEAQIASDNLLQVRNFEFPIQTHRKHDFRLTLELVPRLPTSPQQGSNLLRSRA